MKKKKKTKLVFTHLRTIQWVFPEKIHTPATDGFWMEILAGGGVKDSGNPDGRGLNVIKSSAGVISTDCLCDSNV